MYDIDIEAILRAGTHTLSNTDKHMHGHINRQILTKNKGPKCDNFADAPCGLLVTPFDVYMVRGSPQSYKNVRPHYTEYIKYFPYFRQSP